MSQEQRPLDAVPTLPQGFQEQEVLGKLRDALLPIFERRGHTPQVRAISRELGQLMIDNNQEPGMPQPESQEVL